MINIFQPSVGSEELDEVQKVFDSNWLGQGEYVKAFEKDFADNLQAKPEQFTATTSCTEAIFLAGDIFDFKKGDEVIVPSISFPSIASSIISKEATIVFCDVDKYSLNVRAEDIKKEITENTKAVFITHYGGVPCEMDDIVDLCQKHNIMILEDSACAVRSFYKDKACGTIGDMGMWSFDAMKIVSTGDGGMIYLKSDDSMVIAKEQMYYGLPLKQKSGLDSSDNGNQNWWEFNLTRPGRRSIMNNVTAAIGVAQMKKLDIFINRREEIYDKYVNELKDLTWLKLPPKLKNYATSSYYFFWIQLEQRDELARYLLDNEVYTTFRYWPLHKVDYLTQYSIKEYPNSEKISKVTLNLPLHQSLTDKEVDKVIDLIKAFNC